VRGAQENISLGFVTKFACAISMIVKDPQTSAGTQCTKEPLKN